MKTTDTQCDHVLSDEQMVNAINNGDTALLNTLFMRHRNKLYSYAYSLTGDHFFADDVVQDTLLKAYKSLNQYRNDAKFGTWLYSIARNTWKNHLRSQSKHRIDESSDIKDLGTPDDKTLEHQLNRDQEVLLVHNAIQLLPERQRQAVSLRIKSDLPVTQIALWMRCSVNTVKATYHHGVKTIEQRLAA